MDNQELSCTSCGKPFTEHDGVARTCAKLQEVQTELDAIQHQPKGTELRVCDDITKRQVLGIAKYGKTVEQSNASFREWLQHAYEEALDMAIYLKRAIEKLDGK
jgi:hypothetical protein